jgi:hypothetical protein
VRRILPSSIEYHGERIKLTKYYLDYEDYKDDPDNIDPSETKRVQRLVSEAPLAHSFPNGKEAVDAIFKLKFPGYGVGSFGGTFKEGDGSMTGVSVEIPRADKNRYFTFRNVHGSYLLVDDFIASDTLGLKTVREEHGALVYCAASGETTLVHPITKDK